MSWLILLGVVIVLGLAACGALLVIVYVADDRVPARQAAVRRRKYQAERDVEQTVQATINEMFRAVREHR